MAVAAVGALAATGELKLPGTSPKEPSVGFAPNSGSGASAATQTGTAFLTAWQNNDLAAAANITDNPAEALAALKLYHGNLDVAGITINPNDANSVGWMTFAITTQAGSPMGQWAYQSGFATYSKSVDGYTRWFVKWSPTILYTSLEAGYQLKIHKTPASIKGLVDCHGQAIDPTAHPNLAALVAAVKSKATAAGGTDGQEIVMVDAKGNQVAGVTTLTPAVDNRTVATTLDLQVQTAAEKAVTQQPQSSMVVIQPSTGHILAVANNTTSQYYDDALLTQLAPGSTFKIITSTALLSSNLVTPDETVPCQRQLNIQGVTLNNSGGESGLNNTYLVDFAQSCNNAFSGFWNNPAVTPDLLAETAKTYFGLNQPWDIGLGEPTQYMTVPSGLSGAELAESLVGQGDVVSCPLAMCSVAATVAAGGFKQPILMPDQAQIAATPLPAEVQANLKTLMASVITEGTAASVAFPHNGHFFAKTGTAEVGSGAGLYDNAWFVVFDDEHDLAVCSLVVRGVYGATTAAPECLAVFQALGYA